MEDVLNQSIQARESGQDCLLVTVVQTSGAGPAKVGFKLLYRADGVIFGTVGGGALEAQAIEDARQLLASQSSLLKEYDLTEVGMCCGGRITLFFEYLPAGRTLLIFGGGHCGQALASMARLLGFRVRVYDNREQRRALFPAEEFVLCDFVRLPTDTFPTSNAFVAIMTYNHEFDYTVLRQILTCGRNFIYIGLIGSINKVRVTRQQLESEGITIPDHLFAPIGLNIGAQTPAEIAIAILGEIIGVYRQKPVDSMRNILSKASANA